MIMPVESTFVDRTADFFGPDTPLREAAAAGGRAYEPRSQQGEMAVKVAEALRSGQHLCVEAPTGVGKTYAYLVPLILFCLDRSVPVLVSTHTISLQEQIMQRDLPVLQRLMGLDLKVALAKGRGNYICLRRLEAATSHHHEYLPSPDLIPEAERIREWARNTLDGSRSDLNWDPSPQVWDAVCCEMGNCMAARCPFNKACYFMTARRRLAEAQLIVANHALFFADMGMKSEDDPEEGGILPNYGAVVLDEGHTIEDTAATHLGVRLSSYGLKKLLWRLYNPERNRGLLIGNSCKDARGAVLRAAEASELFFQRVQDWMLSQKADPLRIHQAGTIPNFLGEPVETARREVGKLVPEEADEGRRQELKALVGRLDEYRQGLQAFLDMSLEQHVYWLENQGAKGRTLVFNAAPIEVGPILRNRLFGQAFRVVLTSATLAVKGKMDYFQRRIGGEVATTAILDSPFDYERQVTIHIPFSMPRPDAPEFIAAACEQIRKFLLQSQGRAFVLFTSYRMMQDIALRLADFFANSGLHLLMQGDGLPRTRLLDTFRTTEGAVLFGTDSFWTGVDVPGAALSNVIIVKLPFSVPDHPLTAARQELIQARGGKPFWDYSLPEAILKFRQGFGRLIRSRTDTGIVVVLDNRIIHTNYGKVFLDSLPKCGRQVF